MQPRHKGRGLPIAGIALAASMLGAAGPALADQQPTVVELYTSQGCSDCPPANAAVATFADRPDVLTLSFGVTYWDDLGWKDTFARPQYTQRQWDYARGLHHADVFTPQVVVDGHADTTGQSPAMIEPLIREAKAQRAGQPQIHLQPGKVQIAAAPPSRAAAQVWLVRYDPHVVQVPVRRGENGGKTLPHRDVVFELVKLGDWSGPARSFELKPGDANLKTAILVQAGPGGRIIGSAKG